MKHLLYIFLVLAALFAAIYLLPERSPLFEYYRLRPIFEISSILLLIVVPAGEEASQDDLLPFVSKEFLLGFGHTVWRHIHLGIQG